MEEQFKPITEEKKEEQILPINKEQPIKEQPDIITNLPEWNIEPPLEIKRGEQ